MRERRSFVAVLVLLVLGLVLAVPPAAPAKSKSHGPRATIRWTDHGIPRILARSWKGLGFGYGYALASQNICTIADSYVTVDAQRSRFFGPDKSWKFAGNGFTFNNLDSDFFFQKINDEGTVEKLLALPPPRGPKPQVIAIANGYAAGYDRYLKQTGVANLPDPRCRGADWVHPITPTEVFRRFYQLGLLASQGVAIDAISQAAPPSARQERRGAATRAAVPDAAELQQLGSRLHPDIGSNAVALGSQATQTGHGMMLGNPHFPWDGSERFFESQLTIPGKLNVSGASLYGVPLILIGHTSHLAWSHTVSTAYRFTPVQETLVPGSPTTYLIDGQPHEMTQRTVTVQAKDAGGSLSSRSHTFYSTVHGPVINSLVGLPVFPWTPLQATTMEDANADNFRYLNHFFDVDQAQSTQQLYDILQHDQGVPWVNTLGADSAGHALYADISVVPNVTDQKAQQCDTPTGVATFAALGLPVLDGSRSACDWGTDPDAVEPGIFGPANLPHLFRDDYVTNGNDSYWLSNPNHPLEGYARIIGDQRTARSLRTRLGLVMVQQRLAGSDGLPGKGFTLAELQQMVFNDRQYAGELFRDQLVQMCQANPTLIGSGGPVDVSAACPVLAAWDLHDNLDSPGAVLFRRFASRVLAPPLPVGGPQGVFTNPFDVSDPVNTPNGLNTSNPNVQRALADAVTDLRSNNIPLDATLRDYQYELRGSEKIPIHGGPGTLGDFNAINVNWTPPKGYPDVPHGSSFVMAASLGKGRCPQVRTILTYSQSANPDSRYFADQTRMFSHKQWVRDRFCAKQIKRDPKLRVQRLNGGAEKRKRRRNSR